MKPSVKLRRYKAPALDKGLDIIELLAGARLPLAPQEIAQALQRSPAEIYRMLMCLEERGYLARESESGKFRLTLRLYELGHKQNAPLLLRRAARVPMETLADETGHACHLSVQHGASLLVLMERMPSRRICLAVGEGTVFSLAGTTSGKILLSRMLEEDSAALLRNDSYFNDLSVPKQKSLMKQLAKIRRERHLIDSSQLSVGVTDIAVPVGIEATDAFGVLALSFLAETRIDAVCRAVLRCTTQINRNLGMT